MDKLLNVIHRLVIVAVWVVAVGTVVWGLLCFFLPNEFSGVFFKLVLPLSVVIVGVLFGYYGIKLVNWIFDKE
jgi:hypothetical protein